MQTAYIRLGTAVRCPSCLALTVPHIPVGGRVPIHAYEVTYGDFRNLIEDPVYRKAMAPLIAEWFACSIVVQGSDVRVKNDAGEMIDALWLHLVIQADPDKQRLLYGTAMSLWR
jgi:hypothetical protein